MKNFTNTVFLSLTLASAAFCNPNSQELNKAVNKPQRLYQATKKIAAKHKKVLTAATAIAAVGIAASTPRGKSAIKNQWSQLKAKIKPIAQVSQPTKFEKAKALSKKAVTRAAALGAGLAVGHLCYSQMTNMALTGLDAAVKVQMSETKTQLNECFANYAQSEDLNQLGECLFESKLFSKKQFEQCVSTGQDPDFCFFQSASLDNLSYSDKASAMFAYSTAPVIASLGVCATAKGLHTEYKQYKKNPSKVNYYRVGRNLAMLPLLGSFAANGAANWVSLYPQAPDPNAGASVNDIGTMDCVQATDIIAACGSKGKHAYKRAADGTTATLSPDLKTIYEEYLANGCSKEKVAAAVQRRKDTGCV